MKNKKLLLVIGQCSLVLGILGYLANNLWLNNHPLIAFFSGLLFGLSLVLNVSYLVKTKKK